jgi:hypothetical protein
MSETEPQPLFGSAWKGWESYKAFAQSVQNDLRYVRASLANDFLDQVRSSCDTRKVIIKQKSAFWRARLGGEYVDAEVTDEDGDVVGTHSDLRPHSPKDMKPIVNWQSEGRANPRGIPYLYLATTRETALSEIRPWIGATISVARLQVARDLQVIDCSRHYEANSVLSLIGDTTKSSLEGIWMAIDNAFATPVNREEESKEYIPTQVIAELFRSAGYDGIVYKSLLSTAGFNVVIFDLNDANVINCALFEAESIEFKFRDGGFEYFVSP